MALTMDYQRRIEGLESSVLVSNAYWRVFELHGTKKELLVKVEVKEVATSKGAIGLFSFTFEPDPLGTNYHEQAYEHMKGLEIFQGAKDS